MNRSYLTAIPFGLIMGLGLTGCATTYKPPDITYDGGEPSLPAPPTAIVGGPPGPVHTPPAWTPSHGGGVDAPTPEARVVNANAAARIEPRREGYYNAMQVCSYSDGAPYQIYALPGQNTDIAIKPGEQLTGAGPIAAGDTTRWIIGDTTSGSARHERVHILVKPTRPDAKTNLVISTDRRTYLIELRANEDTYMPSVAWSYPRVQAETGSPSAAAPIVPPQSQRHYRYALHGDTPAWRPRTIFDDGRRVYIVFPHGIVQGKMPPLFVIGAEGEAQIVKTRVQQNIPIVDRLFGAAEPRLGGEDQQMVRIVRTDGVRRNPDTADREGIDDDR